MNKFNLLMFISVLALVASGIFYFYSYANLTNYQTIYANNSNLAETNLSLDALPFDEVPQKFIQIKKGTISKELITDPANAATGAKISVDAIKFSKDSKEEIVPLAQYKDVVVATYLRNCSSKTAECSNFKEIAFSALVIGDKVNLVSTTGGELNETTKQLVSKDSVYTLYVERID